MQQFNVNIHSSTFVEIKRFLADKPYKQSRFAERAIRQFLRSNGVDLPYEEYEQEASHEAQRPD